MLHEESVQQNLSYEEGKKIIIAIGASAGGLEALQEFLAHFPSSLVKSSIIIAQHLSPSHKSMLVQLLSRETKLNVVEALEGAEIFPSTAYITPPDKDILLTGNKIILKKPSHSSGPKPSVDIFFNSLTTIENASVFAVILSGTGTDGASGIKAIKNAGGTIIVQNPSTAKYNGMPFAAIETGCVDIILEAGSIGKEIHELILNPDRRNELTIAEEPNEELSGIDKIFKLLSNRSGTDFSNYKPSTIYRRIDKRLESLKISSIEDYIKFIERNKDEIETLFKSILIGVTSFFRDKDAFDILEKQLVNIIQQKQANQPIRIWVVGCSSGEEAYGITILLCELLNEKTNIHHLQVFASDIDDKALSVARRGIYESSVTETIPPKLLNKYFQKAGDNKYEVKKQIKSLVLFSKHDITTNPPFLKIDLISCRNLLIYFGSILQKHIIPIFHYSLNQGGYLFLGKSETIGIYNDLFATVDAKNKLYQRKSGSSLHTIKFSAFKTPRYKQNILLEETSKNTIKDKVKETIFETLDTPYVVVNENADIIEVGGDIRLYMSLQQGAINANLFKMVNIELQIELRSVFNAAQKTNKPQKTTLKRFILFEKEHFVIIQIKPIIQADKDNLFIVLFEDLDIPGYSGLHSFDENAAVDIRVKELEMELAATKQHLQTYIEELETSNEELQSLNEELQSTNEELQSTNEELETGSEELQSSNEELQIAYSELKAASEEIEDKDKSLQQEKAQQEALLNNTLWGCILSDTNYCINLFNHKAEAFFDTILGKKIHKGDSLINIFGASSLEWFIPTFAKAVNGESVVIEQKLFTKEKNTKYFKVDFIPIVNNDKKIKSISIGLLDTTEFKNATDKLISSENMMRSVFNVANVGICVTDSMGIFTNLNNKYCEIYGYKKEELLGKHFTIVVPENYKEQASSLHDQFIEDGKEIPSAWKVQRKDKKIIDVYVSAELLENEFKEKFKVTSIEDITEDLKNKNEIKKLSQIATESNNGIVFTDSKGKITWVNKAYEEITGYTNKEIVEKGSGTYLGGADKATQRLIKQKMKDQESFNTEIVNYDKKGNSYWATIAAQPFFDEKEETQGWFAFYNNISEKKSEEEHLKLLNTIIENANESIVIFKLHSQEDFKTEVLFSNKAFKKITGFTKDDLLKDDYLLFDFENIAEEKSYKIKNALTEKKPVTLDVESKKKNGKTYWNRIYLAPVLGLETLNNYWITVQMDITIENKFEQYKIIQKDLLLKNITKEVLAGEESKRRWLGIELHDNILQLMTAAKLFLSSYVSNSNKKNLIEADNMLTESIKEIRNLSHEVILPKFAEDGLIKSLDFLINRLNEAHKTVFKFDADVNEALISSDLKTTIYRIVQEQVSNILKHADAANAWIDLRKHKDFIELTISDNGNGIDFKKVKSDGIGLKNIKTRVTLHDGTFSINTEPGKGCELVTSFKISEHK